MPAKVQELYTYPVKAARGQRVPHLMTDTTVGVKNDRIVAIRKTPGDLNAWAKKRNFYVCMNTPAMAIEAPTFDADTIGKHGFSKLHPGYLYGLGQRLGADASFVPQETDGTYSLHDTPGSFVSIINPASARELALEMKQESVNLLRFRMNIWLEDLAPFEELTWVDKYPGTREIMIGGSRFFEL